MVNHKVVNEPVEILLVILYWWLILSYEMGTDINPKVVNESVNSLFGIIYLWLESN
jgi:hypothetical protein